MRKEQKNGKRPRPKTAHIAHHAREMDLRKPQIVGVMATSQNLPTNRRGVTRNLTRKEARFIEEYLVDLNGTQAAIRTGYSVWSAKQIASELFSKPHMRARIDAAIAARTERNFDRLREILFVNIDHQATGK